MTCICIQIAGIILAAGKSSRIGQIKQLLPFGEKTILDRVVENAIRSSLCQVIVVLGHSADQIQQVVDFTRVKVVINKNYEKGQSTSLQTGLAAVADYCDGVMFILGDQPLVDVDVIDALIEGFGQSRAPLVMPTCRGRRGNPVIINRSLFHQLKALTGDVGARVLFEEYAEQIREIEVPNDGINFDVDTWEDYMKLQVMQRNIIQPHQKKFRGWS